MLRVTWRNGPHHATLKANLKTLQFNVVCSALDDGDEPQQIFKCGALLGFPWGSVLLPLDMHRLRAVSSFV